jgi:hypothetical protein
MVFSRVLVVVWWSVLYAQLQLFLSPASSLVLPLDATRQRTFLERYFTQINSIMMPLTLFSTSKSRLGSKCLFLSSVSGRSCRFEGSRHFQSRNGFLGIEQKRPSCISKPFSSLAAPQPMASIARDETTVTNATMPTFSNVITPGREEYLSTASKLSQAELILDGLRSRPVSGGNWKPGAPLDWCKDFGRRSPEYEKHVKLISKLRPGDEGYFDVSNIQVPNITLVRTEQHARIVMDKLMSADTSIFHACDTEVMDIDLSKVGPVGNGYVTCVSIYSGPDFDYGLDQGLGTILWIDNLDDAHGVLQSFKEWFEDERFLKLWHNFGFDRHVLWNEGMDVKGFGGDTMHMARLQDTSRIRNGGGGYSLESLTAELLDMRKKPMKEIFGIPRMRKDGTAGCLVDVPPVEVLQRDPRFRADFIQYSCYDASGTWTLHQKLMKLLKGMRWMDEGTNMYDYYWANMRQFGEVLTDMERRGIRVDAKDYLASVEKQARKDRDEHSRRFREWASKQIGVDGLAMNPASAAQLCTFLFGGKPNAKTAQCTEASRIFKVALDEIPDDALEALKTQCEAIEEKSPRKGESVHAGRTLSCKAVLPHSSVYTRSRIFSPIESDDSCTIEGLV